MAESDGRRWWQPVTLRAPGPPVTIAGLVGDILVAIVGAGVLVLWLPARLGASQQGTLIWAAVCGGAAIAIDRIADRMGYPVHKPFQATEDKRNPTHVVIGVEVTLLLAMATLIVLAR